MGNGLSIITGVPGSGKSYYAVNKIVDVLKHPESVVLSNVKGFRFDKYKRYFQYIETKTIHYGMALMNHGEYIDITEDILNEGINFFTVQRFEKIREKYSDKRIYIFIDEAQRYFPPFLKNSEVIYFFDWHRHNGLEIYLMTQHISKISKQITENKASEIRAVNERYRPNGAFIYKEIDDTLVIGRQIIKAERKIYNLYKSFDYESTAKKSIPKFVYLVPIFIIFSILSAIKFFISFSL